MKFRRTQKLHSIDATPTPSVFSLIINSTVLITGLTWAAYLLGYLYHQIRLDELGFNPDLYPQEATQYFIFAFYAVVSLVSALLPPIFSNLAIPGAILLMWVLIAAAANLSIVLERHRWIIWLQNKLKRGQPFRRLSLSIAIPIAGSLVTMYIPMLAISILAAPILLGQAAGKREAARNLELIARGCELLTSSSSPCTSIMEEDKLVAIGIVVAASDKHVAILEKDQSRSILLEGKQLTQRRRDSDRKVEPRDNGDRR